MRHKRPLRRFRPSIGSLAGSVLALAGCGVLAQTVPDSGRILDTVRERQPLGTTAPASPPVIQRPADEIRLAGPSDSVRVKVAAFDFSGNKAIASSELAAVVAPYTNRELGYAELAEAANKVTQLYRSRGYIVARTTLPPQDIREGRVTMAVQEGVLGEVKVERGRNLRLKDGLVQSFLSGLKPGQVIREGDIERALLVLTDVPGIIVQSVLRPGAAPGTADLVVQVNENVRATGQASFDNAGSRYTGRNRFVVDVALNDSLGAGEVFSLRALTTFQDLTAYTLGASVPLGGSGLRAGVTHTQLGYRLGREYAQLGASGDADATGVNLSMPLMRGRDANLSVQLSHERKHFIDRSFAAGSDTTKASDLTTLGLQGDLRDGLLGPALTNYGLSVSHGKLDRTSAADAFADSISARTAGNFRKLNWQLSRLQALPGGFTFNAALSGQNASKNLDSSEEFFLGGVQGVRAYPQGEAAGDEGVLARLELRRNFGAVRGFAIDGMVFYDIGRVRFDHNPWDPLQVNNQRTLSGAGLGVTLSRPNAMAVSLALAFPGKGGPALTEQSRSPRIWLQVAGTPQFLNSSRVTTPEGEKRGSDAFDLYGSLGVQAELVERGHSTPAGPRGATQSLIPTGNDIPRYTRITDPTNYIGARGAFNLGQGLQGFWQAEVGTAFDLISGHNSGDPTPRGSAGGSIRDTGVGLRNASWGSISYGHFGTPIRAIGTTLDPFGDDGMAAASYLIASPGFGVGSANRQGPVGVANSSDNDDAGFRRRQSGLLTYATPEWKGLSAKLAYSNNHRRAANDVDDGKLWGASVNYRTGPLTLLFGYERHDNYFGIASLGRNNRGVGSATAVTAGTSSSDWDARIGASLKVGASEFMAMADRMSYKESGVVAANTVPDLQAYKRSALWIGMTHTIGRLELRASAGRATAGECSVIVNDPTQQACSTDGLGATMTAVGFAYKMTPATTVFGQYASMRNQASASYNIGVFSAPGFSAGVGANPRGIGFGIKYRF